MTLNEQLDYGVQFFLSNGAISNTLTGQIPNIGEQYPREPDRPRFDGRLQSWCSATSWPRMSSSMRCTN